MKLTSKKAFFVLLAATILVGLLCMGAVVMGSKFLENKNARLHELKLKNEVIDRQKQDINLAKANIQRYQDLDNIARQIVPQDKDQTKSVREIVRYAQNAGVSLQSVTFPSSNLGQKSGKNSGAISQAKPVTGMKGVYELEVVVQNAPNSSTFPQLTKFLEALESNRRTSHVDNINITLNPEDRDRLSFTISMKVYLKP